MRRSFHNLEHNETYQKKTMKNRALQTLLITGFLLGTVAESSYAQGRLENAACGRINNNGRVFVKGTINSVPGGRIENRTGLLIANDDAVIRQDTILGRVEYIKNTTGQTQLIPQIVHSVVYFSGVSGKSLDTSYQRNFVSLDTLRSTQEADIMIDKNYPVIALDRVIHQGSVNRNIGVAEVILRGSRVQQISGRGSYRCLQLDNPNGATVIDSGGNTISDALFLRRGTLNNSNANNIRMLENSTIVRNDAGAIAEYAQYNRRYSVQYVGVRAMTTDREIPQDSTGLKSLYALNDGGITMTRNIQVNDSLFVGSNVTTSQIRTDSDTNARHTLTFTSESLDPVYGTAKSEVVGSMRRTALRTGGQNAMLFNNRYTSVQFVDAGGKGGSTEMTIDSRPQTFHSLPDGNNKVKRALTVSASDATGAPITTGLRYRFGYGWCNVPTSPDINESNNLDISRVILQRWGANAWENQRGSIAPAQRDTVNGWAFSFADTVSRTGFFAIGMPMPSVLCLNARIYMEGPYRNGSMAADLRERNLIPTTPPNIYPYNLDANRPLITVDTMPREIVDWVVVELRRNANTPRSERVYTTAFLHRDGRIMNLDGVTPICFNRNVQMGSYYVAIHHRNHLAVISNDSIPLQASDAIASLVDLTNPLNITGGASAMKVVDCTDNGALIFAMVAGDVNGDGIIDDVDDASRFDFDLAWNNRDSETYTVNNTLSPDTDLSGIVTTRDFNKSWNNRTRRSNVTR